MRNSTIPSGPGRLPGPCQLHVSPGKDAPNFKLIVSADGMFVERLSANLCACPSRVRYQTQGSTSSRLPPPANLSLPAHRALHPADLRSRSRN